jgi:hypothetical protein
MTPYHHDDGSIIDPKEFPIPKLCLKCKQLGNYYQEIACTLCRIDQEDSVEFECGAFISIGKKMTALRYLWRKVTYRIRYIFYPHWIKE